MNTSLVRVVVLVLAMPSLCSPLLAQQQAAPAARVAPGSQPLAAAPAPTPPGVPSAQSAPAPSATSAPASAPAVGEPACAGHPRRRSGNRRRQRRPAAEIDGAARAVAVVDVPVGGHPGQGGDDRAGVRLAGDLDHLHRENDRTVVGAAQAAHGARQDQARRDRWRKRSSRSAPRTACCRRCWRPRCARRGCRREFPATSGIKERAASSFAEIVRAEARRIRLGMGLLATHRRDVAVRRAVRHRVGHHEQLHRHLEIADHQSGGGRAGHRRSAARHRLRSGRGDPGRHHLQSLCARDQRLSRTGQPLVGRGGAAVVARSRPHPWRLRIRARRSRRWRVSIADTDLDDDSDFAETHEINVTPFIDVILVLLIIFMVAAPLSTVDLPIDLPSSTATPQKKPDKPTYVSIKPDLAVAIGETPVKRVDLVAFARCDGRRQQGSLHLPARRPRGALWRADGRAGNSARRRLPKIKLVALEGVAGRHRANLRQPKAQSPERDVRVSILEQKPSRRLWIFAAAVALALHVGGAALAIARMPSEDRDDSLGAPAIEIGLEMIVAASRDRPICRRARTPTPRSLRRRSPSRRPSSRRPSCRRTCRPKPTIPIGW